MTCLHSSAVGSAEGGVDTKMIAVNSEESVLSIPAPNVEDPHADLGKKCFD